MRLLGTVFRAHNPRWSFAPASGDGAARHGGRFNPVGTPALYASLRPETAWREAQQGFAFKAQPLTIVAYDVDCDDVADLTDPEIRAQLRVATEALACPWDILRQRGGTPPSWEVASRLRRAGYAAAIVPSFAPGRTAEDRNAVFWRWSDAPPHRVAAVDAERRLPRDARSWG